MNTKLQTVRFKAAAAPVPQTAMVLAAGLGKRMRPITDRIPKPMVRVHGKTLIDHALDALAAAGVARAVVNVHHLAEQIEGHVAERAAPKIVISDERDALLESGGGVAKALPLIGGEPFYILNSDTFWVEGYRPNLLHLAEQWDPERMDMLLLLASTPAAVGYGGAGDFTMDAEGRLTRRKERQVAPFAYAGAAIARPAIFTDLPAGPFSLNLLFDRAIAAGRLFGIRLDGLWLHVGTPDSIAEAEEAIARSTA
ncbi:MAG: nucleotidyltransferase family protein [Nitratireductor sp.]|jgi:MurNAc alpha-1-phosphate uridylyltransferase|nr:nucleotidyltransferase family protein [Nitratireductor sp.]